MPGNRNSGRKPAIKPGTGQDAPRYERTPHPPEWLGPVAKTEWRRLARAACESGVLDKLSRSALAAACAAYEELSIAHASMHATSSVSELQERFPDAAGKDIARVMEAEASLVETAHTLRQVVCVTA